MSDGHNTDDQYPVCPDCGERHAPDDGISKKAYSLAQAVLNVANGQPILAVNLLITAVYHLLKDAGVVAQLEALQALAEGFGIQANTMVLPRSGAVMVPGNGSIN